MSEPPEPKRGGTFLYCPWTTVEAEDGVTYWWCGWSHSQYTGSRFRTLRAYRRHWRRRHP